VDLWVVRLDAPDALARLASHLSPDETARADRFVTPHHRARFAAARGALRVILGAYLERPPADVAFAYERNGKPVLADRGAVRFSLSHAGGLAVVAGAGDNRVGPDGRQVRSVPHAASIVERHFAASEQAAFRDAAEADRMRVFFACWTRKEAYLKGVGRGITGSLAAVEVLPPPSGAAGRLRVSDHGQACAAWSVCDLELEAGHLGALAVEGSDFWPAKRAFHP
jgi:4'-phosphopantetheinyl transferase